MNIAEVALHFAVSSARSSALHRAHLQIAPPRIEDVFLQFASGEAAESNADNKWLSP
jgi:hypothetical protein